MRRTIQHLCAVSYTDSIDFISTIKDVQSSQISWKNEFYIKMKNYSFACTKLLFSVPVKIFNLFTKNIRQVALARSYFSTDQVFECSRLRANKPSNK